MTNNDPTKGSTPLNAAGEERPSLPDIAGPSPLDEGRVSPEPEVDSEKSTITPRSRRPGHASRRKLPGRPFSPLKILLFFLALPLVLYSLIGFAVAPYLLTTTLPSFLAKKLNRPVTIGSARVNPYTLHITLKNGIIGPDLALTDDKIDPILSFGKIEGRINPAALLKKGTLLKGIRGNSLFIHLDRQKDGKFNITTLLSQLTTSKTPFNFRLLAELFQSGDINLTNSRLIFSDQTSDTRHTLEEISFSLPKRDTKSAPISPRFSAVIDGSPISVGGQSESSASGQNTRLTFTLENIHLADYLSYLPRPFPGLITKGDADLELLVDLQISPDKTYQFEISGSGTARDIWLHSPEKGENKIASAHFFLRFDPLRSRLTINKLILDQPEIQFQKQKDGTYIFPGADQKKTSDPGATIDLETLVVKNGRLSYIDQQVKGGFGAIFNEINLSMDRPKPEDTFHAYALNCVTSRKTRIASQGKISITKKNVEGLLILHNLPVAALNSYLPPERGVTLSSGIIDKAEASLDLRFSGTDNIFTLSKIKGSATKLDIFYQGKEWLHIDQGLFSDVTLASDSSKFFLGNMTLAGLLGHITPADSLFLASLLSQDEKNGSAPFAGLEIKNGTLLLHDFSFQKNTELPVKIATFKASNFGGKEKTPGKIYSTIHLPQKGKCTFQGDLSLTPVAGTFQLAMEHVPLNIFSAKQMSWFAPRVHNGTLSFNGTFSLPDLSFDGRASLSDFTAQDSASQATIIALKKAVTPQINLRLAPFDLNIGDLDLDTLELFATLSPQVDSLTSLFISDKQSGDMAQGNMEVKNIRLKNGSVHFSDQTLNPPFSTSLTGIQGSLTELTNSSDSALAMDITGHNDDQATLSSKGSINLFSENFAADLNISLLDQPLAPFIPYLETMVGYGLGGGIFDITVSYKESTGKVNAASTLILRDLSLKETDLGNKQFPTSVALVTDNDHIVRIDIPVIGDTTDPSYTFHSAYGKKLRSLISKASVSPFSLLTEFYESEQPPPDHVFFEVGSAALNPEFQRQLTVIKDILQARPLLTVTVKGYSAGTEDRDAILKKKSTEEEKKRIALQKSLTTDVIVSYGKEEIETPARLSPGDSSSALTVSKEELLSLAMERCLRIKEILVEQYGLAEDRILISPEASVVPSTGAGLSGNRVDFILGRVDNGVKQDLP